MDLKPNIEVSDSEVISQAPTSRRTSKTSLSSQETQLPAYDDIVGGSRESVPAYIGGDAEGSLQFPVKFNLYYKSTSWKKQLYRLGEHRKEAFYSIVLVSGWKGTTLCLHEGLDDKSPMLAEVAGKSTWSLDHTISLPGRDIVEDIHTKIKLPSMTYSFTAMIPHGEKLVPEQFEWRQSHGQEVRQLTSKFAWGWKLIRLGSGAVHASSPAEAETSVNMDDSAALTPATTATTPKKNGKRAASRDPGEASDGKEVVAVWADNVKWSKTKRAKFEFWGRATTGEMGETFAIMAVATGLRIWQITVAGSSGGRSNSSSNAAMAGSSTVEAGASTGAP